MSDRTRDSDEPMSDAESSRVPTVPDWEDEYVDRVSDRLMFNFDLEKDFTVRGRTFTMYGEMQIESRKQLLHPALNYANHEHCEHLFVSRTDTVSTADLESLVELGHDLADEWIEADEQHFGTDFTFVVIASVIPESVREFVAGFRDRTLLKFGFYGSYEVNLVVVSPEDEEAVGSQEADVVVAFRLWESLEENDESKGFLRRLFG